MSMSAQGRSRLNCVWRWRSGFPSAWSPPIHIRAGEKVCIQAMRPMHRSVAFASAIAAAMPSADRSTGRATMRTGTAGAASRAATISAEFAGDLLERRLAVQVLTAGEEPDLERVQRLHRTTPAGGRKRSCNRRTAYDTVRLMAGRHQLTGAATASIASASTDAIRSSSGSVMTNGGPSRIVSPSTPSAQPVDE